MFGNQRDTIYKKIILCLILAVSMLFVSICSGTVQSDSSLMYGIIHQQHSVLKGITPDTSSEPVYTETSETLLSATAFFRQESRRITNRIARELSCLFLIVELLSQIFPLLCAFCFINDSCRISGTNRIIHYIHSKDGKKNR